MKKILFLLLLTSISYGQTTLANKLKITGNITDNAATKINVQDATGLVNTIAKTDLIDVIEVTSATTLPLTGVISKIYCTLDNNKIYRWTGTIYQELAVTDISGKVDKNTAIVAGTNTKITYDAKGLVTAGGNLIATDIPNITESQVTNLVADLAGKQSSLGYTPENVANKSTTLTASTTLYPNNNAVIGGTILNQNAFAQTANMWISGTATASSFIGGLTGHASLDLLLTGGTLTGGLFGTSASFSDIISTDTDFYLKSNLGNGILSANGTRAISITNTDITLSRALSGTSGSFSSILTVPTAIAGTNNLQAANTAFVQAAFSVLSPYTIISKQYVNSAPVTGTTAITTLYSVNIPANTFIVGDVIIIRVRIVKTGSAGSVFHRVTGALNATYEAGSMASDMERVFVVKSATNTETNFSVTDSSASSTGGLNLYPVNTDWTISQTVTIGLNNTSTSDSSVVSFYEIIRQR